MLQRAVIFSDIVVGLILLYIGVHLVAWLFVKLKNGGKK